MIKQDRQRQIIESFGLGQDIAEFKALPHPWNESHTFMCVVDDKKYVVRRWRGDDRLARMHEENARINDLKEAGFSKLSLPLPTSDDGFCFIDDDNVGWTAYEYVDGGHISTANFATAKQAGKVLAELHDTSLSADFNYAGFASRLQKLPDVLKRMKQGEGCELAQKIERQVLPKLKSAFVSPVTTIHGDFIFENLLMRNGDVILIDFEFSRKDHRLFDVAAATVAPLRNDQGEYILADRDFMKGFIGSYAQEGASATPLTQQEISLIPAFSAAHFAFVYDDLTQGQCPFNDEALRVLDFALSGELDWIEHYKP